MGAKMPEDTGRVHSLEISEKLERRIGRRTLAIRITVILIGLAVLLGLSFLALKLFVTVSEIDIEGLASYAPPDIAAASGIEKGTILPFVSAKSARENILSGFPMIMDVEVLRVFPDKVVLRITEEEPRFYFEIEDYYTNGKKNTLYAVVARSGKILSVYDSKSAFSASGYAFLPKVVMPKLRYAVEGEKIVYDSEGDSDFVSELLDIIDRTSFGNKLLWLDAQSRFDIAVYIGEAPDKIRYEIRLGNKKKLEDKLLLAECIATEKLDENSYMINVEEITEAFARKL